MFTGIVKFNNQLIKENMHIININNDVRISLKYEQTNTNIINEIQELGCLLIIRTKIINNILTINSICCLTNFNIC